MMDTCDETKFLSCIGKSKKDYISTMKKSFASCDHLFPKDTSAGRSALDEAMAAFGECIETNVLKNYGISTAKVNACE